MNQIPILSEKVSDYHSRLASLNGSTMRTFFFFLSVATALATSAAKVDNFVLLDHLGNAHELYYYSDSPAIVLTVQGNGCPIVRNALPDLKEVRDRYETEGVVFLMINSNLQDDRESIRAETADWNIDFPILVDETQMIGSSLGLTRTAEVLVIDPKSWELTYRGPLNDRLSHERQKVDVSHHYVADVLDGILGDSSVRVDPPETQGCLINFEHDRDSAAQIFYDEDVAPILQDRCMGCQGEGGIGSWSMSSYAMVKGFSPMIREVLRTRRMPPWHADPHIGEWQNDRSLTIEEKQTLIQWVEAGSLRGEGEDPLERIPPLPSKWSMGEPDMVVELPAFTVPAQGVVEYQYFRVPTEIVEGVWVRGMEVLPGNTKVVHHVLFGTVASDEGGRRGGVFDNYIGGKALGSGAELVPEDTGTFIPPDLTFLVQMHYTPYGKDVEDTTRIGLYLYEEPPERYLRHGVAVNPAIEIPSNEKARQEFAYFEFDKDAILYEVLPHSHYRGRSSTFTLQYTDGSEELLLNVPDYDFNWQTGYRFSEPKRVPAGAKLVHSTVYDNSELNPGNPDPTKIARWGLQSWDEMLYGAFTYRWTDETTSNPIHQRGKTRLLQSLGILDKDFDGLITIDELQKISRVSVAKNPVLHENDTDDDERLNLEEFQNCQIAMQKLAAEARRQGREQQSEASQQQPEGA